MTAGEFLDAHSDLIWVTLVSIKWDRGHREEKRERMKRYKLKLKHDAIVAYGGKCIDCECKDEEKIEFDHNNGNGNSHRSSIFGYGHQSPGGWNFYLWLKKVGYPKDLDLVLRCDECHDKKHPERPPRAMRRGSPSTYREVIRR